MMVGGNRGEMQSAKTSSPSLFVTVSLSPSQAHSHTYTKNGAASSSLSTFELIQTVGNKGLQGRGREGEREARTEGGEDRRGSIKSMGMDMGRTVESRGKGLRK